MDTVILDVDGTLLDSNYHHTVAWARAFTAVGLTVPLWRIHRHIGMGGDRLVAAVADDQVEDQHGDEVRDRWKDEYDALIDQTRLLAGSRELLGALRDRGLTVALASSSNPEHAEHAFDLLGADDLADAATTAEDASESKPHPELLEEVLARVQASGACMVGDSVWDVQAASAADVPTVGVLSGGYSRAELLDAGAVRVYDDPEDLLAHLAEAFGLDEGDRE